MSDTCTVSPTAKTSPAPENAATKPAPTGPKPCCVCKDERATRDECMLFSEKGESQCLDRIAAYKACMAGFGFKI